LLLQQAEQRVGDDDTGEGMYHMMVAGCGQEQSSSTVDRMDMELEGFFSNSPGGMLCVLASIGWCKAQNSILS
jgi:hypothetical protein